MKEKDLLNKPKVEVKVNHVIITCNRNINIISYKEIKENLKNLHSYKKEKRVKIKWNIILWLN